MALIKCKECGHTISDKAVKCPNCGCPIQYLNETKKNVEDSELKSIRKRNVKVYVWAIVILCLLGGGGYYFYTHNSEGKNIEEIVSNLFKYDDIVELTPEFIETVRKYDELEGFSEGFAAVKQNEKWGYVNSKGELVIPCKYDEAEPFHEGFAAVRTNGKYGFINTKDEEIVPCKYDVVKSFSEGYAAVRMDGKEGFVNTKGEEIIPRKYDAVKSFSEGYAAILKGGKEGFINTKGEEVIPCNYDGVKPFSEGYAAVRTNGRYGFINTEGEEVIPCKYNNVESYSEGLAVFEKEDKLGFINFKGEEVFPCIYDEVYAYSEGFAAVKKKDKYGFINIKGEEVIPCKYDAVTSFFEGFAAIKKDEKWGYVNTQGEDIIPCKYNIVSPFSKNGVALVYLRLGKGWGVYGFVDKSGKATFSQSNFDGQIEFEKLEEEQDKWLQEEKEKEKEERKRNEENAKLLDWLKGTWQCNIDGGAYLRVTINASQIIEIMYLPSQGEIKNTKLYKMMENCLFTDDTKYIIDRTNKRLLGADGTPFFKLKAANDLGQNGFRSNATQSSTYSFFNDASVIDYLSKRTFSNGRNRVKITFNGVYINGDYVAGVPKVVRYEPYKAYIRALNIYGMEMKLIVDPVENRLIDQEDGDVYHSR